MKLLIPGVCETLDLVDELSILKIENHKIFSNLIQDILIQMNGERGQTILSENDKKIEIKSKVKLMLDVFDNNRLTKETSTSLLKYLVKLSYIHYSKELFETNRLLFDSLYKIILNCPYILMYRDNVDLSYLLKAYDVRLCLDSENQIDNLINYMEFVSGVDQVKLFVIVNFCTFFDEVDFNYFIKMLKYKKLNVLFLEGNSNVPYTTSIQIPVRVIDSDLCLL